MYVVCLNLVLCILVDAYGETQAQHTGDAGPSLFEQGADTASFCVASVLRVFTCRSTVRSIHTAPTEPSEPLQAPPQQEHKPPTLIAVRNAHTPDSAEPKLLDMSQEPVVVRA